MDLAFRGSESIGARGDWGSRCRGALGKEFLLSEEPEAVVSISVRCEAGDSCRGASVSLA